MKIMRCKVRKYNRCGYVEGQVCAPTIQASVKFWQLCGAISLLALDVSPLNLVSLL